MKSKTESELDRALRAIEQLAYIRRYFRECGCKPVQKQVESMGLTTNGVINRAEVETVYHLISNGDMIMEAGPE